MDGIHDLGGKAGYGAVVQEDDEPAFHYRWEAKVFAMQHSAYLAGAWHNTDRFRHLVERIEPEAYLNHGYYGRWLGGIEAGLVEAGIVDQSELNGKVEELGGDNASLVAARPQALHDSLGEKPTSPSAKRQVTEAMFHVGQKVKTSAENKPGHTRLPSYARNKVGTIVMHHQGWVFPDTNAHGRGENPQHLYTVQFTGKELWGDDSENIEVHLDLFEPYLIEKEK